MAPERSPKRQKTLSGSETPSKNVEPAEIPLPTDSPSLSLISSLDNKGKDQRASFFSSWSRKAPPITQIARESIKSASNAASEVASSIKDVSTTPRSIRSPSLAMTLGRGQMSRASLADATTTMVHAEANSPAKKSTNAIATHSTNTQTLETPLPKSEIKVDQQPDQEAIVDKQPKADRESDTASQTEVSNQRSSWLGWLAKGDGAAVNQDTLKPEPGAEQTPTVNESAITETQTRDTKPEPQPQGEEPPPFSASKKGWISFWGAEATANLQGETPTESSENLQPSGSTNSEQTVRKTMPIQIQPQVPTEVKAMTTESFNPPSLPHDSNKASAWAFWSRDRKVNDSSTSVDKTHEGEIAVSDTPSQNKPRKASISMPKDNGIARPEPMKPESQPPEHKKSISVEKTADKVSTKPNETLLKASHKKQDSKTEPTTTKAEGSNATASATEPTESIKPTSIQSTKPTHNLLLPSFYATLKLSDNPSLLLRLANLFYITQEPVLRHLSLVKDPPRIKNALAIGVHGYFPTTLIRSVLGQPTGTSIKFADMAAKSIKRWTASQGYECQVKTAALEGEGKIAERIELLWRLLLNWIDEIRNSDFIMIACHSQGVPVAIMLVAKLIHFGCVNSARVCICAMAGVNMGPFPEYKSRWIGGSAGELFEFSDPTSRVSTDYLAALEVALKFGVRLTYVGSIDDQLVSLESSVYSTISHPHIFRAVSIDSRVHAPSFISHLVGFALKLRNLGVQDHGLIRELSTPLAGSLYTGEGHSRLYEDDAVYDLAVAFAMETTTMIGIPISQRTNIAGGANPYILPFAMRGILEEEFVKNELQNEVTDLLKEFDDWKPTSKALKDVKFRLEGIRSKM